MNCEDKKIGKRIINKNYKHTDIPDEIIEKELTSKKKIIVRFSCLEDAEEFSKLTGIHVDVLKHTKATYPPDNRLVDMLGI